MVQQTKIRQCNPSYKQTEDLKKEPHDHCVRFEKGFDKIQHPFMIKSLSEIRDTRGILNIKKQCTAS